MAFYANDSVSALSDDILLKCGKLYAKKFETETTGTTGTVGATCAITLASGVPSDDYYNGMTLYIQDDNGALAYVTIDDSETAGGTVTVDTTASVLVSDEVTAGSFTSTTSGYNIYILGTEQFVGYSTQTLDYEEETVVFDDCNEKVREDVTKIVLGFSGDCKNFSSDKTFANVFGLTQYGSQSSQKQYHGGFSAKIKDNWQIRLATENVDDKNISITMFKGSFFSNGSVDFSAASEYKVVPYSFKAVKDELRDTNEVNGWKIVESTV